MSHIPLPIAVTIVLLVTGVLINSTVRFYLDQHNTRRRVAAVVSSLTLLVLLSIFYASAIGDVIARIGIAVSDDNESIGSNGNALADVGSFLAGPYRSWWLDHLPTVFAEPNPTFHQSLLPLLLLGMAYSVRFGIYLFLRDQYRRRHEIVSASWVHITLALVALAFLREVYGYGFWGLVLVVAALALAMVGGIMSVAGDLIRATVRIGVLLLAAVRVSWKYVTIVAGEIADAFRWLRREFARFYATYVRDPASHLADHLQAILETADATADRKLQSDEDNETEDDGQLRAA